MAQKVDGHWELLWEAVAWTAGWVALFYVLSSSFRWWSRWIRVSSKAHENDKYWCARNVIGSIHAIFVSVICVPATVALLAAPRYVQFGAAEHLATCEPTLEELKPYSFLGQAVALSGLAFTCFTLADVVVSMVHGLATPDYIVHHAAFVTAGVIIRANCMLPLNAAVLMAMEVSTPFLNYLIMFRHRGDEYKAKVISSGIVFFITFLIFRLGLNLYGTAVLWIFQASGEATPARVPGWQGWFLACAVTLGALVQLWWLPGICKNFGGRLLSLLRGGSCAVEEEDDASNGGADGKKALLQEPPPEGSSVRV